MIGASALYSGRPEMIGLAGLELRWRVLIGLSLFALFILLIIHGVDSLSATRTESGTTGSAGGIAVQGKRLGLRDPGLGVGFIAMQPGTQIAILLSASALGINAVASHMFPKQRGLFLAPGLRWLSGSYAVHFDW